ncbi:hypothetical protein HDE_08167 [Halotydeus destructor]|nr:hypothetical protein HDE_08167 [Halotydeus destructor]
MASVITVIYRRSEIEAILYHVWPLLENADKVALRRYGLKTVAVYMASATCVTASVVILFYPFHASEEAETYYFYWNKPIRWYHVVYVYAEHTYQPLVWFHWHIITIPLYIFVFKAIAYAQKNQLNSACHTNQLSSVDVLHLAQVQKSLNIMKKHCNNILGIFPFLWISSSFIRASGLIASIITIDENDRAGIFILFAYDAFVVFYAILSISYVEEQNGVLIDKLIVKILRTGHIIGGFDVMVHIIQEKVKLTALNIFEFNKSLLLSFTASLISFTVLFLQMSR